MVGKGFEFSLDAPLRVKKINMTQLESRLVEIKNEMVRKGNLLYQLTQKREALNSQLAANISEGINAGQLKEKGSYIVHLNGQINSCDLECKRLKTTYKRLQDEMIKLLNEINTLEKLKEQKIKEYKKNVQKQEEKALEGKINYKSFTQGGRMYG